VSCSFFRHYGNEIAFELSEENAFFRAVIAAVVILAWQLVRGRKFRLPASRKSLILLMADGGLPPAFSGAALAETDNLLCVSSGRPRSCDILRRPGGRQQQVTDKF